MINKDKFILILLFLLIIAVPVSFASENSTCEVIGENTCAVSDNSTLYAGDDGEIVGAGDVYFDASASSGGDGSQSRPYNTVTSSYLGTTNHFRAGTYRISTALSSYTSYDGMTFIGEDRDTTILEYAGSDTFITTSNSITFTGITIKLSQDATGTLTVKVGNNTYNATLVNGTATVCVDDLKAGNYTASVSYSGDDNYAGDEITADFHVEKTDIPIDSSVLSVTNSSKPTFTVKLAEDATGTLTVKVGNNTYNATLVNGTATVSVDDLAVGDYDAIVSYSGDGNYSESEISTKFTVEKVQYSADEAFGINLASDSTIPTFTIKLPSDATGNFTVTVDGKNYTKQLAGGSATITLDDLAPGKHNVSVSYSGDGNYSAISQNTTVTIPTPKLTNNKNINVIYSAKATYKVRVTVNGKAVVGEKVSIKYNGKTYSVKTDKNGYASLKLKTNIKVKKYTITAIFKGVTVKNTVKIKHVIKAKNKNVKKSKKVTKIKITLKKVNKKYLKGKKVKIKFRGKTYKVKTNKKGVAKWKVKKSMLKKLKVGKKYKYKVTYGKDKVTKKLKIKR